MLKCRTSRINIKTQKNYRREWQNQIGNAACFCSGKVTIEVKYQEGVGSQV